MKKARLNVIKFSEKDVIATSCTFKVDSNCTQELFVYNGEDITGESNSFYIPVSKYFSYENSSWGISQGSSCLVYTNSKPSLTTDHWYHSDTNDNDGVSTIYECTDPSHHGNLNQ